MTDFQRGQLWLSRLDAAATKKEKLEVYASVPAISKRLVAGLELERAGGVPVSRKALPGMFPPTVYGAEAKDAYEQATEVRGNKKGKT